MTDNERTPIKYALIADIHGNLPALLAVLEDAKAQGATHYLFLGDYAEDFPWPNEVVDRIRTTENSVAIRGNKEDYFADLHTQDQRAWTHEQFAALYWNYRSFSSDTLSYLLDLPPSADIVTEGGKHIYLSHSQPIFLDRKRFPDFFSSHYLRRQRAARFDHREYLASTKAAICAHAEAMADIGRLPPGVHAFGHNHLQWHMQLGDRLFVNPGSSGMPLDCKPGAPYTLLEPSGEGWHVEERRVCHDIGGAVEALRQSDLYAQAKVWCDVMIRQQKTGEDVITFFLRHTEALAQSLGYLPRPVSNEIWRKAAETFVLEDHLSLDIVT